MVVRGVSGLPAVLAEPSLARLRNVGASRVSAWRGTKRFGSCSSCLIDSRRCLKVPDSEWEPDIPPAMYGWASTELSP